MRRPRKRRALTALAVTTSLLTTAAAPAQAAPADQAAPAPAAPGAVIRVDQVGYATTEAKRAYLMTAAPAPGAAFTVVDARGRRVLGGRVGASTGHWSDSFGAVHPIDLTALRRPGSYRLRIGAAESPAFRVGSGARLFGPGVADTVHFFQAQRDGRHVLGTRRPSHLTDRRATVYEHPVFAGDGGDVPGAPLTPMAGVGPVDVEGGWFDAGDFVKFTHATAYSLAELLYVQRLLGRRGPRTLPKEAAHGLAWLDKAWDRRTGRLAVQVGIGTGSEEFGFLGDHDVWRLPEADDALTTGPGDPYRFIRYRPVFLNGRPGEPVSPNLAGRGSAAFGLAAQLAAASGDRSAARRWYAEGASLYARARTTGVGELVTAFPHAYYPEDSWTDDMEFGATQLALAARALRDRRASAGYVRDAARWARAYLDGDGQDTLNLYDTSALGHADLARLLPARAALRADLVADLRRQLDAGVTAAAGHPFGHAVDVSQFDAASRSFGFAATAGLYRELTGDRRYDAFGTAQRNFAFGANAWGTSLMVGAGTVYPRCPQHQVSNLAGPVRGAVVNGPNGAGNFEYLGIPDGANACPADGVNRFAAYDRADARYLDDVRAWPSSEPAIDFTSTAMLALALAGRNR